MTRRAPQLLDGFRSDKALAELTSYLRRQRWFAGRARDLVDVRAVEAVPLRESPAVALWSVQVRAGYAQGDTDDYHLLLSRRPAAAAVTAVPGDPRLVALAEHDGVPVAICDAMHDSAALAVLWAAIAAGEVHAGVHGEIRCLNLRMRPPGRWGRPGAAERGEPGGPGGPAGPGGIHVLRAEQSNTSAVRDGRELLKCLRRVAPGASPELELTDALARAGFRHLPTPLGALEYHPAGGGDPTLLAIVQPYLTSATEGWALALESLRALYAAATPAPVPPGAMFTDEAAGLGLVTGEMHLAALRTGPGPRLRPRPVRQEDLDGWAAEMTAVLDGLLAAGDPELDALRPHRELIAAAFDEIRRIRGGMAIRIHGDYHLGQTLRAGGEWTVIDFEGEPDVPLRERWRHSCPLRDVAGMLRSFDYAAAVALAAAPPWPADPPPDTRERAGRAWTAGARAAFWAAYTRTVAGSGLLPGGDGVTALLRAFELRKAVYEVGYELGHRPAWVGIPLRFLLDQTAA